MKKLVIALLLLGACDEGDDLPIGDGEDALVTTVPSGSLTLVPPPPASLVALEHRGVIRPAIRVSRRSVVVLTRWLDDANGDGELDSTAMVVIGLTNRLVIGGPTRVQANSHVRHDLATGLSVIQLSGSPPAFTPPPLASANPTAGTNLVCWSYTGDGTASAGTPRLTSMRIDVPNATTGLYTTWWVNGPRTADADAGMPCYDGAGTLVGISRRDVYPEGHTQFMVSKLAVKLRDLGHLFDVANLGWVDQLRMARVGGTSVPCAQASSGSTPAPLTQQPCRFFEYRGNQNFLVVNHPAGDLEILSYPSGKCLDVTGGTTAAGAALQTYSCHDGLNQRFRREVTDRWTDPDTWAEYALYRFRIVGSDKCLTLPASGMGGTITQEPCVDGEARQRFDLE